MDKITREIFKGNLSNASMKMPRSKQYDRLNKKEYELYEKLQTLLSPELKKLFDDFVELYGERNAMIEEKYYVRGFKIGLRLGIEACDFTDIDEDFDD